MPMDSELNAVLSRRCQINDQLDAGLNVPRKMIHFTPSDFSEFSRKQLKEYERIFKLHNSSGTGFMSLDELKRMMEKLGAPQTHLGLKEMIAEVDEDKDGKISFREFLLIFRKAAADELTAGSGLSVLAKLTEVDVDQVGVGGAKQFFEAKIEELTRLNQHENEIREEQMAKQREEEERKARRDAFKNRARAFEQPS